MSNCNVSLELGYNGLGPIQTTWLMLGYSVMFIRIARIESILVQKIAQESDMKTVLDLDRTDAVFVSIGAPL